MDIEDRIEMKIDKLGEELVALRKENKNLKEENKKLKAALDEEGIEPESEVLGKKLGDLLTGKELKIAAEKGLKVRYIEQYYNPQDRHMNFNADCVMEKCNNCEDEDSYYIGNSDIDLYQYAYNERVCGEVDEGTFEVRRAKGVKYI